ncbi:hypothetical protein [Nonomuraea cavernae]|uniref:hypothetical protein n=1 Tax=Nonomuraea cavernae TaxID=2045107 RepID=UPI00166724D3|nr:hypothetical protein [Nonomuraea cavernae]MCA2186139.1 hypothetical protein [Nonomuraea cavernae]
MTEQRVLGGRYRLVARLGGTDVWRARDESLRRDVAVTQVAGRSAADLAAGFAAAGEAVRGRAIALTAVHDLVVDGDTPWLVMRLDPRGRRTRALAVAAVCAAAVAVTATTLAVATARPPHFSTPPQACDLLTVEDLRTLVAQAQKTARASSPPDPAMNQCQITSGDAAIGAAQRPTMTVWVTWRGDDEDKAGSDLADRRQNAENVRKKYLPEGPADRHLMPVSGLADEAFYLGGVTESGLFVSMVGYRYGAVVVDVHYLRLNGTREEAGPMKERLVELAHRSLEGLER